MLAFEVSINGERACLAGVGEFGIVSTIVTWVRRIGDPPGPDGTPVAEPYIYVGGRTLDASVKWIPKQVFAVGDSILIRIVDVPEVDPPRTSIPFTEDESPEARERQQRAYYEHLKAMYEPTDPPPGGPPDEVEP